MTCTEENSNNTVDSFKEIDIKGFEKFIASEDMLLAVPTIIQANESVFIFDVMEGKLIEVNSDKEVINYFGGVGRGPGEFISVNNFFLHGNYIYAVDRIMMNILKYDVNGEFIASLDYGALSGALSPPPPPPIGAVNATEIDNEPIVTANGEVILSKFHGTDSLQSLYDIYNWKGEKLNTLGEVIEGSTFILDNEKIHSDIAKDEIPSFYRSNSFLVNDLKNPEELFLVFSSLGKILKYNKDGTKLWDTEIQSAEMDTMKMRFFEIMDKIGERGDKRNRIGLEYFSSGFSNKNGELFLVANTKPISLYKLSDEGVFIEKYTLVAEEGIEFSNVVDISFELGKIFVASKDGEIYAAEWK